MILNPLSHYARWPTIDGHQSGRISFFVQESHWAVGDESPTTNIFDYNSKRYAERAMSWNPLSHYARGSEYRRAKILVPPAMRLSLPSCRVVWVFPLSCT